MWKVRVPQSVLGFLTDDLTVQPNMTGGMAKYLGVCKLAEPEGKHRRIDIIVTPYSQVCGTETYTNQIKA